jgi:hypothetical protein
VSFLVPYAARVLAMSGSPDVLLTTIICVIGNRAVVQVRTETALRSPNVVGINTDILLGVRRHFGYRCEEGILLCERLFTIAGLLTPEVRPKSSSVATA